MTYQLHYYCSSRTFLSILQNSELWLTALDLSNDHLEGRWALQQYLRLFKRQDRLRKRGAKLDIERALSERVVLGICFSEKLDLLSQWRGYADNGRGVCLTFRTEGLRKAIHTVGEDVPGLRLGVVNYDSIESRELPKILNDTFRQDIEGYSENKDGIGSLSRSFTDEQREKETNAISALFEHKSPAFREEGEWRLFVVQYPSRLKKLEFRDARDLLSPFLRLHLEISAIDMVTLGPRHPTPMNAVENLIHRFNCSAEVRLSSCSYVER